MDKTCSKCRKVLPLDYFYFSRRGRRAGKPFSSCKTCVNNYKKTPEGRAASKRAKAKYRNSELGKSTERLYKNSPQGRAVYSNGFKKWKVSNPGAMEAALVRYYEKYPEKRAAKLTLRKAVRYGKITKPRSCQRCATTVTDASKLHGHHEDYSKPLDVVWVCQPCHVNEHRLAQ